MTTLTIVVPCYNSADYMGRCVDSLLAGGSDVEIIIVNDGSTDTTAQIADDYQQQFPNLVKVIHKTNGGHGSAINYGLAEASGTYLKIVDSDDWLDPCAYAEVLRQLRDFVSNQQQVDLVISNFVYENEGKRRKGPEKYHNVFPSGQIFDWESVQQFRLWQYLLMHSMIYRTDVLRDCGLKLPEHSFYVDNLYAFIPLKSVKKLIYIDVDLYRYFIGREDQSVNEKVMLSRIDQQIRVNREMFIYLSGVRKHQGLPIGLLRYLIHYLEVITMVTSILLLRSRAPENIAKKEALWVEMESIDATLTAYLRGRVLGKFVNLPGKIGRETAILGYKAAKKVIGFS